MARCLRMGENRAPPADVGAARPSAARRDHARYRARSAPAAAAPSMCSARASARCSTSCRPSCACCASAVPSTVAAPAARSIRPQRPNDRSPRGAPARACWPMCWSASTATTRRFTDNRRSSPATGSRSIARPWRTGLVVRVGGWSRCTSALLRTSSLRPSSSPTTRRCRCSIPAAAGRRPDDYGFTPVTIDLGLDRIRRLPSICIAPIASRIARPLISKSSAAYCKSTAMPDSNGCHGRRYPPCGMLGAHAAEILRGP